MDKNIPSYVKAVSKGDIRIIEDIFKNNYREFMCFYHVLKDYSGMITKFKYKGKKNGDLVINVSFDTKNINEVFEDFDFKSTRFKAEIINENSLRFICKKQD
jgi:hypothetical protein